MTLELKQRSEPKGASEWKWSVWLAGTTAELATVESVVYHLHPTFPDPIRTVTDRKSGFRLDESGWGEFELVAHVNAKNAAKKAAKTTLKRWLDFSDPTKPAARSVFISSSLADADSAQALQRAFEKQRLQVVSADSDAIGSDYASSLETTLRKTSAAVMIMSDKSSPWTRYEVDAATKAGVRVFHVQIGEGATPGALAMKGHSDADRVAKQIVKTLGVSAVSPKARRR